MSPAYVPRLSELTLEFGMVRESLHVQLIDDQIRFVVGVFVAAPVEDVSQAQRYPIGALPSLSPGFIAARRSKVAGKKTASHRDPGGFFWGSKWCHSKRPLGRGPDTT